MVKFDIYDYDNGVTTCTIPNYEIDDIKRIDVTVLSGDETVDVVFKDGSIFDFDASETRGINFYDGSYVIDEKKDIEKWLNFVPSKKEPIFTFSYERQAKWG